MAAPSLSNVTTGESLGTGCCGSVFAVEGDDSLVIKQFNSMAVDRQFLARNSRRLAGMPEVEGMAKIHDFQAHVTPFQMLMNRVEGETLPSLLGTKEESAWAVIRQLAETLGHAHKYGVVHGHLHPDNVRVVREKKKVTPMVTDFGSGMVGEIHHIDIGESALFAAPEQLMSEGRDWREGKAERWDVYSFGMVAFWLINERIPRGLNFLKQRNKEVEASGGRPVDIDTESFVADMQASPKISWGMSLGLSRELKLCREIIDRCLSLDPEERPVDMREVRNQFRALDHQFAIENAEDRVVGERKKQRSKLYGARGLAACLAVFFGLATFYLVNYLKKTYFFQNKVTELDQVVLTQKATITHLDERWADTVTDLKTSREAADSFFQKMARGDRAGGVGNAGMKREELEKSRDYYLKTLADVGKGKETAIERGRALHSLAHIERQLDLPEVAIGHFNEAIGVMEGCLGDSPPDEETRRDLHLRLADSYEHVTLMSGNPTNGPALKALKKAVAHFDEVLEERPDDVEVVTRQAATTFQLGDAHGAHQNYEAAIDAYSKSADLATGLKERTEGGSDSLTELIGRLQFRVAKSLRNVERIDDAINAHVASMETVEELRHVNGFTPVQSIQVASSFIELGELFAMKEATPEDLDQLYNEALRLLTPLNSESPEDIEVASLLCRSLGHLGAIERGEGQWTAGYRLSIQGIETLKTALGDEPMDIDGLIVLARARLKHLDFLERERSAAIKIALSGVETSELASALLGKSTQVHEPRRSMINEELGMVLQEYGEVCKKLGQTEAAERCFSHASTLLVSLGGKKGEEKAQ